MNNIGDIIDITFLDKPILECEVIKLTQSEQNKITYQVKCLKTGRIYVGVGCIPKQEKWANILIKQEEPNI